MMVNITQLDSQGMLASIDMLAQQVKHAWSAAGQITLPPTYRSVNKIVVFGMGGSALGGDIIRHLCADQLSVPLLIENSYQIPAYVDEHTLAIVSSYSGNTEETVTITKTIQQHTNTIIVITTGGALKQWLDKSQLPGYIIDPRYNPCGQPRIAVGYAVVGLIRLLTNAGLLNYTDEIIDNIIHYLDGNRELLRDAAQDVANEVHGKIPIYVGADFLLGNVHTLSNQTNENGKNFSAVYAIPELNHHLMEGLGHPRQGNEQLRFVFIESSLYHDRVQKRFAITKQILEKNNLQYSTFITTGGTPVLQSFEVLQWGSYMSFYLAMANAIDPSPIPWVDYFKDALKK